MEEPQEEMAEDTGDITALAKQVGQGLAKFAEAVNASETVTEKDKGQMAELMNSFIDLVENKLNSAPGQDVEEEEPELPVAPAMGGVKGIPMSNKYK